MIASIQSHLESQIWHHSLRTLGNEERSVADLDGRVGNRKVSLDQLELSNRMSLFDSFKIIGAGHFGTVKTNCGVFKGK